MPEPPSNVKIYDRPERKGPSPLAMVLALVVALLVGFLLYKTFFHPTAPPVKSQVGMVPFIWAFSSVSPENATLFLPF